MVTKRLYDWATVVRSKNAGPFTLTVDLMFPDDAAFHGVLASESFCEANIAAMYGVPAESVRICPFERIRTIKVSLPRGGRGSGSAGDRDVYGCQQHFPLAGMEIGIEAEGRRQKAEA